MTPIEPLDFGSAIHEGMEVLYDPKRWNDDRTIVLIEAHAAFMRWMNTWKTRLRDLNQWDSQKDRHAELVILGKGMLDNYVEWVTHYNKDKDWEPKYTEVEFEVPIPVSKVNQKVLDEHPRFNAIAIDGMEGLYLHISVLDEVSSEYGWQPVYYQGRIDLIIEDIETGKYWIVDHKTAAQFGSTKWFDMDTQTRSYCWAIKKMLGIDVEGVMFNRLRKKVPSQPTVLKSGELSRSMSQSTTPALYRAAAARLGLNIGTPEYVNFLSRFEGQVFNDRPATVLGPDTLEQTERAILFETIDMLGDPLIYPNPGMFNCSSCQFYAPCQAEHDGQDPMWVLDHSGGFTKRS